MTLGQEKRTGRRIPINCPVLILLEDGRELLGLAHDLSVEGIRFDCPVQLRKPLTIRITRRRLPAGSRRYRMPALESA